MIQNSFDTIPEVFISYASKNHALVQKIVEVLRDADVSIWMDEKDITGGSNYGPDIVKGIKGAKLLLIMCSASAMRSKNVKQEIQIAWKFDIPYLPLMLEEIQFPEQVAYWLEGFQWIEYYDRPTDYWLPRVLKSFNKFGIHYSKKGINTKGSSEISKQETHQNGLNSLRLLASFTDQIWPISANRSGSFSTSTSTRGLGAPQNHVQHSFQLNDHVCIIIETEFEGNLLLLNEGADGIIYCLCPSWFAPVSSISKGSNIYPQAKSRYNSFQISGKPGREQILALITKQPIVENWLPADLSIPSRVLTSNDVNNIVEKLKHLDGDKWMAFSTYFDVSL